MTNHWIDIKNTDCVLIIGSNAAENHPISFKWIEEARRVRGAKLIVVDPRISRSAAKADIYARMRSGTDIAFIGGLIRYALENNLYNDDYVKNYTNLPYLVNTAFRTNNDINGDGYFYGYSTTTHSYNKAAWAYDLGPMGPQTDPAFGNLDSVYRILWSHYSRYTPDMVASITGMDKGDFLKAAAAYCATGASNKSGTIMYAMGTTQHTVGAQNIRTYAILQLLLGNIGVAGGGINALRGESNVQGSTDMCLLFHILPGYLPVPNAGLQGLGVQVATATLKVDTTAGPGAGESVQNGPYNVGDRVIRTSTDLTALGVRTGDKIRNTDRDTASTYTIEALWSSGGNSYLRLFRTVAPANRHAGLAAQWLTGDNFTVDSSSGVATTAGTYLAGATKKGVPGVPDVHGTERLSANWWQHTPKYMVSLLAAWWGGSTNFTAGNDFCYDYLPKTDPAENYSHISVFEHINALGSAVPQLMMCWGQNPAVGGPQAVFERAQLAKLDTLVCVDLWETETASFWKADPGNPTGGSYGDPTLTPANISTAVYLLPAKASMEKEGSVSNSGRWVQWRYPALHNGQHVQKGSAKADLDIINDLFLELKTLYAADNPTTVADGLGVVEMTWGPGTMNDYGAQFSEADPKEAAKEYNGFAVVNPGTAGATRGSRYASFGSLKFDGSTASGNWLYCGMWPEPSADILTAQTGPYAGCRGAKRVPVDNSGSGIGLYSNWSWCWPINRRIIYNRASLKPVAQDGYEPYADDKWVIKYNYNDPAASTTARWYPGGDVPDGGWYPDDYMGFIMKEEGAGHIWGLGLADGPLAEHYEPAETPLAAHPFGATHQMHNPTVVYGTGASYWAQYNFPEMTSTEKTEFNVIGTTYRLVEHWQAGAMTRNLPWLAELQPGMFCEMSEELAASLGVSSCDRLKITTRRNINDPLYCTALVTKRFRPFTIMGNTYHQVGLPWHFGYRGIAQGGSANLLTPHIGDPNTRIPEYKAFLCKVEKA